MDAIEESVNRARRAGERYREFLRVPSMSVGVYVLPAGAVDGQSPHTEDEVYFVVRGRAQFTHLDTDRAVGPGDVLFVPARDVHRFHTIAEELVLLVVFAPAESSPAVPK
jgi:mannose-6-phosphate isomerase-like protein (cupin superfamily)